MEHLEETMTYSSFGRHHDAFELGFVLTFMFSLVVIIFHVIFILYLPALVSISIVGLHLIEFFVTVHFISESFEWMKDLNFHEQATLNHLVKTVFYLLIIGYSLFALFMVIVGGISGYFFFEVISLVVSWEFLYWLLLGLQALALILYVHANVKRLYNYRYLCKTEKW